MAKKTYFSPVFLSSSPDVSLKKSQDDTYGGTSDDSLFSQITDWYPQITDWEAVLKEIGWYGITITEDNMDDFIDAIDEWLET